jgi:hypothetical protein
MQGQVSLLRISATWGAPLTPYPPRGGGAEKSESRCVNCELLLTL